VLALIKAAVEDAMEDVKSLIEKGVDVNVADKVCMNDW